MSEQVDIAYGGCSYWHHRQPRETRIWVTVCPLLSGTIIFVPYIELILEEYILFLIFLDNHLLIWSLLKS